MSTITFGFEAKALPPTIEVYRFYFNTKYPCTEEENDGTTMSLDDWIKFQTYNHLLSIYNKSEDLFKGEYERLKKLAAVSYNNYQNTNP